MKYNFTPCPDILTEKYGLVTSAVFGAIDRYSKGDDGYCWASQPTIAKRIGMTARTVRTHIKILLKDGVIQEHEKNGKRGYKPTKDWQFSLSYGPEIDSGPEINSGDAEIDSGGAEIDSGIPRKEIPTKREVKREYKKEIRDNRPLTLFVDTFGKIPNEEGTYTGDELCLMLQEACEIVGWDEYKKIIKWSRGKTYNKVHSRVNAILTTANKWTPDPKDNDGTGGTLAL